MPDDISFVLPQDRLLSKLQVANWLGVSPKTVQRLCAAGKLPSVRVGVRAVRWKGQTVLDYLAGLSA